MATALIPVITNVGSAAYAAAPSLIAKAKKFAPGAYTKLKSMMGPNTSPEAQAQQAVAQKNNVTTSMLIGAAVKAGVPINIVGNVFPMLSAADLALIEKQFGEFVALERAAADQATMHVSSPDPVLTAAFKEKEIEAVCDMTGYTSDQLGNLLTFFKNYGPKDIAEYQKGRTEAGKRFK